MQKNDEYIEIHNYLNSELKHGNIKAFCTGYTKSTGRYFQVETDQGWNPENFWQEFHPDPYMGNNDTSDLYI